MHIPTSIQRAGEWFLHSGIQEPSGGFARYFQGEIEKNKPVSSEISGYAASALVYLYKLTGNPGYLDAAVRTARFLTDDIWNPSLQLFPFEHHSSLAYFFDSGIIIRGLLAVWRETHDPRLLDIAIAAGKGMSAFRAASEFHPVLELPARTPAPRTTQWSRGPGCYQTKSALAWWELAQITGDNAWREAYTQAIDAATKTHRTLLAHAPDRLAIVDRLHAYCYFLEALTPLLGTPAAVATYAEVMAEISTQLRNLAADFSRADVYAQLLRARLNAAHAIPLDREAARQEAHALYNFQAVSTDAHLNGGFLFGQRAGKLSLHASPVPTTFALQAIVMWEAFQAGETDPCPQLPI